MKHTTLAVAALLALTVVMTGCRTNPVYNVERAPVHKQAVQIDDVRKAIMRAGLTLGWTMEEMGSGSIVGTLALRTHVAVVDITYDTTAYDIKYKDSTNLDYDGNTIHQNYNGWIQNLDRAIRAQIVTL